VAGTPTLSTESIEEFKLDESVTDYGQREKPFVVRNDHSFDDGNLSDAWLSYNYLRRWFYTFGNPYAFFTLNVNSINIIYLSRINHNLTQIPIGKSRSYSFV